MDKFKAFRIREAGGKTEAGFTDCTLDELDPGDVVVRVSHSTINYKDALAATGKGRILSGLDASAASIWRARWCPRATHASNRDKAFSRRATRSASSTTAVMRNMRAFPATGCMRCRRA